MDPEDSTRGEEELPTVTELIEGPLAALALEDVRIPSPIPPPEEEGGGGAAGGDEGIPGWFAEDHALVLPFEGAGDLASDPYWSSLWKAFTADRSIFHGAITPFVIHHDYRPMDDTLLKHHNEAVAVVRRCRAEVEAAVALEKGYLQGVPGDTFATCYYRPGHPDAAAYANTRKFLHSQAHAYQEMILPGYCTEEQARAGIRALTEKLLNGRDVCIYKSVGWMYRPTPVRGEYYCKIRIEVHYVDCVVEERPPSPDSDDPPVWVPMDEELE